MPQAIHVISPVTGTGNKRDLELVVPLLEQTGFNVTSYPIEERGKIARSRQLINTLIHSPHRFDVNIFMGPIFPEWLPLARKNVWIPNPEGFSGHLRKWLPRIDLVLAKTRMTERIFRDLGCRTEFIGFTSRDHFDAQVSRDYTKFFHACSSPFKGTKRLLETWKSHPEWPEITVVISNDDASATSFDAPNIRIIAQHLPDSKFTQLQNSIGFHICCSEVEGFGHYIMEAMSCGVVTFTANGPPMNEMVQPSRGILLDCLDETSEAGLSHRYFFRPESLEEQIKLVMSFDKTTIEKISTSARAFFLENDHCFRRRFPDVIRSL